MSRTALARLIFLVAGAALVALPALAPRWRARGERLARGALALLAVGSLAWTAALFADHLAFPLNLEPMESAVLAHVRRVAALEHVYTAPSPGFVALAYNPLYYVVAAPFTWLLGARLAALRLVSVLAALGCAAVAYRAVGRRAGARWWGLVAAGLLAAAYPAMDRYLDTAHADACFLLAALLGTHVLDRRGDAAGRVAGLGVLVLGFWFKQHGALFALVGALWLLARDGPRRAWPALLAAALLGPVAYLLAGPALFGSHFHEFTWAVPRRWSTLDLAAVARWARFVAEHYPVLAAAACAEVAWVLARRRDDLSLWHAQLGAALASGLMGSLDPGSSNNVYIPLGTWLVLVGALGLARVARSLAPAAPLVSLALVAAWATLLDDPRRSLVSPAAPASHADLRAFVRALPGTVYMPWQGPLPEGDLLWPTAHEIALEDRVRGPGRDPRRAQEPRRLLAPVLRPRGPAWVLTHHPLGPRSFLSFLAACYVLDRDLGARFAPLHGLPRRFDNGWPRYLYRHDPARRCPAP